MFRIKQRLGLVIRIFKLYVNGVFQKEEKIFQFSLAYSTETNLTSRKLQKWTIFDESGHPLLATNVNSFDRCLKRISKPFTEIYDYNK